MLKNKKAALLIPVLLLFLFSCSTFFYSKDFPYMEKNKLHSNNFALIITGDPVADSNEEKFWDVSQRFYMILHDKFNYNDEKIFLLYNRGKLTKGAEIDQEIIDGDASRIGITFAIKRLKRLVSPDDLLIIYVQALARYVNTYPDLGAKLPYGLQWVRNDNLFTPNDLSRLLDSIDCRQVIFIETCFSGIWIDSLEAENRVVMTSTTDHRLSYGEFTGCLLWALENSEVNIKLSSLIDLINQRYLTIVEKKDSSSTHLVERSRTLKLRWMLMKENGLYIVISIIYIEA